MSWDGIPSYVESLLYSVRNSVQAGGDYSVCSVCNLKTGSLELFVPTEKNIYFKNRYIHEVITAKEERG